ncbi:hypothetical protein [Nocardioides zeae]|uniref:WXG100 family type VII secretion target n=1 Tax=Nocardioides zeae TaxID=1457234 RepID=A0A6P0HH65_9ACTN|nr:hypothetical protein [Nocardioides zeae]NEN77978.1 hypothetical protein [Nocardioides zeae]
MSSFHGMDTEQVAALGTRMTAVAERIRTLEATLTSRLQQAAWQGPDRERFVQEWDGAYVASLRTAATALEQAAAVATENVRAQESVSA